jgi:hypothetical protein
MPSTRPVLVAFVGLVCAASPVAAQGAGSMSGRWLVSGKVASLAFTLTCTFDQAGESLTGVCVDGSTSDPKVKGGRGHKLTQGRVNGDRVTWTYQSSFLLTHFNVDYSGVRRGQHITGQIMAQGHPGTFTADRAPP